MPGMRAGAAAIELILRGLRAAAPEMEVLRSVDLPGSGLSVAGFVVVDVFIALVLALIWARAEAGRAGLPASAGLSGLSL